MSKSRILALLLVPLLNACASASPFVEPQARIVGPTAAIERPREESAAWWYREGAATARSRGAGRERAKNLILFIGDGMSLPTVAAARIFEGQRRGQPGEENLLSFERFPYTAFSKTYNTDSQTPDSAGTTTAMVTGAKTRTGMLSVGQQSIRGDCVSSRQASLATLLELAESAGLSTGVVTTTRITHATPAATYAHSPERSWENDTDLPADAQASGCVDIARQLVEFDLGNGIEVVLGGGRANFRKADDEDPEYPEFQGNRLDGRDLIGDWQGRNPTGRYVWNKQQLDALDPASTPRLLGLFEPGHMNFEHDRPKDRAGEPSLAEMTRAAITILRQNPNGFFLMVEGGRIDHAHHAGNAYRALVDTVAFSDAIRIAVESSPASDTLIVVTADHSHTLNFVGYPGRGNPILGKVRGSSSEEKDTGLATDALGLPYTTLSYANGPGYGGATDQQAEGAKKFAHLVSGAQAANGRPNLREVDTEHPDYLQESAMPIDSETHGGDDVGVWAVGPGAMAVRGTLEQNVIFHLLVQSQPRIVEWLCKHGDCEDGVPARLPADHSARK